MNKSHIGYFQRSKIIHIGGLKELIVGVFLFFKTYYTKKYDMNNQGRKLTKPEKILNTNKYFDFLLILPLSDL